MAIKPWEDGEEDTELFTEIENLFEWNKMFDDFDKRLAALKQWMDEEATLEEEKAAIEKGADNLTRLIEKKKEKGQRSVPGLKVLSAVAVCKNYKNSVEIQTLASQGRRMEWAYTCEGHCQEVEKTADFYSRCGFCRSVAQKNETYPRLF